jgi:hypothetical protein
MCLVLALSAVSSFADTLYNNLGPGNVAASNQGYCLGTGNCATSYWVDAIAFTPSTNAALTDIGVALGYVSGQNWATIELLGDSGGLPGSLIESWTVSNLPTWQYNVATPATFVTSGSNPILDAGQQYWVAVIAGTPGDKANLLYWMAPQMPAYTPFATSQDGGPYTIVPNPYVGDGGFRVDGTPVPEPSSLLLFAATALGFFGPIRRKLLPHWRQ